MRLIRISIVSFAVLGLTACSTVSDRYGFLKDETQSYQKAPPLERTVVIPQNLNARGVQDFYEVPEAGPEAANIKPPLTPPGSNIGKAPTLSQQDRIRNAENAKIQGHTNISANTPTSYGIGFSQAWMKVGQVLQASNYKIVEKDKVLGTYYVIDTQKTGGKVKKDMPIYQVNLKASGNSTVVSVNPGNAALQSQINRNLNS